MSEKITPADLSGSAIDALEVQLNGPAGENWRALTEAEAAVINRDAPSDNPVRAGDVVPVEYVNGHPQYTRADIGFRLGWEADADLEQRRTEELASREALTDERTQQSVGIRRVGDIVRVRVPGRSKVPDYTLTGLPQKPSETNMVVHPTDPPNPPDPVPEPDPKL